MINKDFYPTPVSLIKKMIKNIDLNNKYILEPSAGKGDICDYIKSINERAKIDCVEIEEELRMILNNKKYNVIHDDFLTFETSKKYDFIIANFPFSNGDEHLLKSIELLERNGGALICLVNAETIKNTYSNIRKSIKEKLDKNNAIIKFLEGEFENAERKTNVEVALIMVEIEKEKDISLILDSLKKSDEIKRYTSNNCLIENEPIKKLISMFNYELKAGETIIREYHNIKPLLQDSFKSDYKNCILELNVKGDRYSSDNLLNNFLFELRKKYWKLLLRSGDFIKDYTQNIISDIESKIEELGDYDFTTFNINNLEKEMNSKIIEGIEKSILKLFDDLSYKYSYNDDFGNNIHYYNGWKTNKAHKINNKVIIPFYTLRRYNNEQEISWENKRKINDMVKVFNYLSRERSKNIELLSTSKSECANEEKDFRNIDYIFFDITFYKKGTAHIKFKDLELLEKFNIYGSMKKGWLPPSYGKKKYQDMDIDEKKVIDEFNGGEEEYNKVILDNKFYIVDENKKLLN